MSNIVILSNERIFNLEKDDFIPEDYKTLSGIEVRHVRNLQHNYIISRDFEKLNEGASRVDELTMF